MAQDLSRVLREEISRLAKKEIKRETASTRRSVAQYRRDIAELKRTVKDMSRKLDLLERQEKRRLAKPADTELAENARFSPTWLKKHRERTGLSAADYAKLVGVSSLSIYNWENGKARPRKAQLARLVAIRNLRKREARQRLEMIEGRAG